MNRFLATTAIRRVALLEPSVASECVVTEMMGQVRCGAPFLAGAIADAGFEVRVFAEELIEFDARLMDRLVQDYDAIGLSLALNTLPRGLQVARALKRRRPDLPIIAGGPSTTNYADRLLTACDAVLRGRGEVTLVETLKNWPLLVGDRERRMAIPGWCERLPDTEVGVEKHSRNGSGPGMVFPDRVEVVRNRLPVPIGDAQTRYDLIEGFGPLTVREGLFGLRKPAVYSFFASTGCIRQCLFCKSEKCWTRRGFDRIIGDLELILRLHGGAGLARFMLVDDCLFGDIDWLKELLRRIAHATRGHAVSFAAQFHVAPTTDDELMRLFKEAQFTSLAIGFESVSQASLDHEHKGTTLAANDRAIEQCRRFGIVPYGYFIAGFDTDTEDDVTRISEYICDRGLIAQILPVGIMNRDEFGEPTPEAAQVLSDTSFGATVFVSHRPKLISAPRLQELINTGWQRISSLRRLPQMHTRYEREFLFGQHRSFQVWEPAMHRHIEVLRSLG